VSLSLLCACADTFGFLQRKIHERTGIACEDQMLGNMHGYAVRGHELLKNLPNNVLLLRNMCVWGKS